MSWASGRRFLIVGSVVAFLIAGIALIWIASAYEEPTCIDGKLNQDEEGIDCGGSCQFLCKEGLVPPATRFVRTLSPSPGRTDVIAYLENANQRAAATDVRFVLEVFDRDNAVVGRKEGSVTLPPASIVPVYVPNFLVSSADVTRAFLTVDEASYEWVSYQDERVLPKVRNSEIIPGNTPRIVSTLYNPTAFSLTNVKLIVTVFNAVNTAIAASQTVLVTIPAQGEARATFTWPSPFTDTPARVEVIPVLPL